MAGRPGGAGKPEEPSCPGRAAYPATVSSQLLSSAQFGQRPGISLSGRDGRGVTIALLDTGVDRAQPFLRGRVTQGIDTSDWTTTPYLPPCCW